MADVKWIKLSVNMFDDEKIKLIEQMPDADALLVVWIKLLSQAGKTNASGYIYLNENIPYTDEMLAAIFNRPLSVIRLALQTFKNFGMIEIDEQSFISIANWEKHQNIDGLAKIREQNRKRVAEHRKRKRQELIGEPIKSCAYCGRSANTVDHIKPISKGGPDVPENVVSCCKSCNSSKKDKDLKDFLNDSITHYHYQEIDHELVRSNEKLMNYVYFDGSLYQNKSNVTVTLSNATDIELELEVELEEKEIIPFVEIINHLNDTASTNYRSTTRKTKDLIQARWNEGFRLDDFKQVINIKTREWINDANMSKFIRPDTLFGTKFESYLNQKEVSRNAEIFGRNEQRNGKPKKVWSDGVNF